MTLTQPPEQPLNLPDFYVNDTVQVSKELWLDHPVQRLIGTVVGIKPEAPGTRVHYTYRVELPGEADYFPLLAVDLELVRRADPDSRAGRCPVTATRQIHTQHPWVEPTAGDTRTRYIAPGQPIPAGAKWCDGQICGPAQPPPAGHCHWCGSRPTHAVSGGDGHDAGLACDVCAEAARRNHNATTTPLPARSGS